MARAMRCYRVVCHDSAVLFVIKDVESRDQIEAMLAAQTAAVHIATMTFARPLAHLE
jgi:hypothetical protein